ncbi:unnamed protein product [Protopolystoma xenopodis]|uniref:Uncharacterized protein n=1 Tax=Protopolystoma xenopodis TaxID=117903 RepID=A0A448XT73_9PLAT|nr:unnamed protein product [Protopolystoma xenopodis]
MRLNRVRGWWVVSVSRPSLGGHLASSPGRTQGPAISESAMNLRSPRRSRLVTDPMPPHPSTPRLHTSSASVTEAITSLVALASATVCQALHDRAMDKRRLGPVATTAPVNVSAASPRRREQEQAWGVSMDRGSLDPATSVWPFSGSIG